MKPRSWFALCFVAGSLGLTVWTLTLPFRTTFFGTELRAFKSTIPAVALSYNGVPDSDTLAALLELLAARGAQATFFVDSNTPVAPLLSLIAARHELGVRLTQSETVIGVSHHLKALHETRRRLTALGYAGSVPVRNQGRGLSFALALWKMGVPNVLWSEKEEPGAILMLSAEQPDLLARSVDLLNRQKRDGRMVVSFSGLRKLHRNL